MKGVTDKDKDFWVQCMDIILRVVKYMEKRPREYNPIVECHSICRGLAHNIPELTVVDGHYLGLESTAKDDPKSFLIRHCDHSWLLTPDQAIIDPYPVGFISTNPVLIGPHGTYSVFSRHSYVPDPTVTRQVITRKVWRKTKIFCRLIDESART